MEKINVVLIMLNKNNLREILSRLDFKRANLVAVVINDDNGGFLQADNRQIPMIPFAEIQQLLSTGKNFIWLLNGCVNGAGDLLKMKKFLTTNGIPEKNIVNFESLFTAEWFANLRYVEKYGADFFATGISYMQAGLDLNFIPHVRGRGVNLSGANQDLQQSYLTAKYVFEHVKPGTIKFVLIGLAPYSFRYDNAKAFSVCSRSLQYIFALTPPPELNHHDELLMTLTNDNVKNFFKSITAEQADLNFDRTKQNRNRPLPAKAVIDWETELKNLTKKLYPATVEKNFRILKQYIRLCVDNGAKPVGVILPFAPAMHDNYNVELLTLFRLAIRELEETTEFTCIDLFDLKLGYDCFYNMAHLNLRGAMIASSFLGLRLYEKNLLTTENLCGMNYEYFNLLSNLLNKDDYNDLMERVFAKSAELISRKNKIKVGFVVYYSSMWCGDELYNFFARDKRFETRIFLCLRTDKPDDELVKKDFLHGEAQFKSRGLNVTAVDDPKFILPAQDVLIYLTPYLNELPVAFKRNLLTARTLLAYIPYAIQSTTQDVKLTKYAIFSILWKVFFESTEQLKYFEAHCKTGMPRGIYSGHPKQDVFFDKRANFRFKWKMARPDAKKIIWAPHWSIGSRGVKISTFQWNYKFMYEFAKNHPEISWVVKPHQNLLFSAVSEKVFATTEDFKSYLRAWDELPNAQVVTGGYYQEIFATSDGMIHDSGSFIAEYQYTHNPMIYLTRDTQDFNEFGKKILEATYCIDGRDLDGIAALMRKVFIDGDDPLKATRQKVFDEQLNYFKTNGMIASEFIYRNISDALK